LKVRGRIALTVAGLLAIVSFCCLAMASGADRRDLRPDPSFGEGGSVRTASAVLPVGFDRSAIASDSRGRLLVLGATRSSFTVSRYLANGRLDPRFAGDGVAEVVVPGLIRPPVPEEGQGGAGQPEPTALAIQPDGGVLLLGAYEAGFGPGPVSLVARLRPNGAIDADFGGPDAGGEVPGQAVPLFPNILAIASQGRRILVAGGGGRGYVARLDHQGKIDRDFGEGSSGRVVLPPPDPGRTRPGKGAIAALVVRRDGGFYAGGYHKGRFLLARLGKGGALDRHFGQGGLVTTQPARQRACHCSLGRGLARDRRGRLLLVGTTASSIVGFGPAFGRIREPAAIALARYRPDGSLDRSFGRGGIVRTRVAESAYGHDVVAAPGGAIFVAATSSGRESPMGGPGARFTVLRYGPFGDRQGIFTSRFGASSATGWDALLDQAGRIVVAGTATQGAPRRVRSVLLRFAR
jgi:uncharacterized delta-60 repeat protein